MTDKERYEAAMEENHRLREELKDWKESFNAIVAENKKLRDQVLNLGNKVAENEFEILEKTLKDKSVSLEEDYRKISELYIKEQQKNGELEQINQNLTNRMIKMEVALQLREETEVTTNTANAE